MDTKKESDSQPNERDGEENVVQCRDERIDEIAKDGYINEIQNDGFEADMCNNYEREKPGKLGSQPSFGFISINSATEMYSINCK